MFFVTREIKLKKKKILLLNCSRVVAHRTVVKGFVFDVVVLSVIWVFGFSGSLSNTCPSSNRFASNDFMYANTEVQAKLQQLT